MVNLMKAVIIDKITPAANIRISEVEIPKIKPGWVLIKIEAFGLNHSEKILRLEEINESYIQKPVIPGIECVGIIENPSDSNFQKGQKVISLMGGMGRSFNGSYRQYAILPAHHVFSEESNLTWEQLAAVPETFFTAWGSLFECLQLKQTDKLLVRGATCALGYAAIQIAKAFGCKVVATTHKENKLKYISNADEQILDEGILTGKVKDITKVLDLVGPKSLKDSLTAVEKGAIVCNTGILGGVYELNNFDPIKDIPNGVYLTGFFSNYPTQQIIDDIFNFINKKNIIPNFVNVFDFKNIKDAITAQDTGTVDGKIVVKI